MGTAGAVRHHQDQKDANQQYASQQDAGMQQMQQQQAQLDAMQQQQYAPPPPPAPAPAPQAAAPDLTAQLQQLAQLHTAGVLSDQEFAEAKQKVIAGG